jgi:hypothetical protein
MDDSLKTVQEGQCTCKALLFVCVCVKDINHVMYCYRLSLIVSQEV